MKAFITIICLLATNLIGCQNKPGDIEIKKTQLANETNEWNITLDYSAFSSKDSKIDESCKILNKEIETLISSLQDSIKSDATDLFEDFASHKEDIPEWKYALSITDSVFMATSKFISIRIEVYTYTGGAHGMTYFQALNYDVENKRLLTPKEIINSESTDLINKLLAANFENETGCFDKQPRLEEVAAINIGSSSVDFIFEQYILGAYACGIAEISIPINKLKEKGLISNLF